MNILSASRGLMNNNTSGESKNINNYYIVCNKLHPHNYDFNPLLVNVNMSDEDFLKFCENIYKYVRQPLNLKDGIFFINDISLNTTYNECFNIQHVKGRMPFFVWGKSVSASGGLSDMINRFNELNNCLYLEDESYNISNPFIINQLLVEYFKTGKILDNSLASGGLSHEKAQKRPVFNLNRYNFGNTDINTLYNYDFEIFRQHVSKNYEICIKDIDVFNSNIVSASGDSKYILENIPLFENKYADYLNPDSKLRFHVYAICYNESRLLPHFLNHYREAEKIFVIDNHSTDNSCEIVRNAGRDIIKFDTGKIINEAVYKFIKNNIWKLSRGKVDFVIVQDLDEFLYFPECSSVGEGIAQLKKNKIPLLTPQGYNICFSEKQFIESLSLNLSNSYSTIIDYTVKGYRNQRYDKCIIFNPNIIKEINYKEGAHECNPVPAIETCNQGLLLHYKHIGEQYEMKRKMFIRDRMSKENLYRGFATEYFKSDKDIILEVKKIHADATNIYDIVHQKPKITCNIRGGLGNQMFMIAATLAYAWRNGFHPIFRTQMELSHNPEGYWTNVLRSIPYNNSLDVSGYEKIEEDEKFIYEPIKTNRRDTVLTGYYQSIKYFEEYEEEIRNMFNFFMTSEYVDRQDAFRELINNTYKYIKEYYKADKLVGIFVRRGDYVQLDSYSGKWLLPIEYYKSAIEQFKKDERYKNCAFVVFSNDTDWCKQHFPDYFTHNSSHDIVQFYLLAKMDGWILANSTFSWWAEFLGNPDKTKKVIAPYPWLKNYNYNNEIYREYWEKINW